MKVATMRLGGYGALRDRVEIQGDLRWNVSGHASFPFDGPHRRHGQEQGQ